MFNSILAPSLLLALILILRLFPDTDLSNLLKKILVDAPSTWLLKVSIWQILSIGMIIIGVVALVPAMPFDMVLLAASDATAYFEISAALTAIAFSLQWKSLLRSAKRLSIKLAVKTFTALRRVGIRATRLAQRSLRFPAIREKRSDDDDGWPSGVVPFSLPI